MRFSTEIQHAVLGCCPAPKCERRERAEGGNGTEPCRLSVTSTRTPSRGDSPNVPNAITIRLNTFRRRLVAPSRSVFLLLSLGMCCFVAQRRQFVAPTFQRREVWKTHGCISSVSKLDYTPPPRNHRGLFRQVLT